MLYSETVKAGFISKMEFRNLGVRDFPNIKPLFHRYFTKTNNDARNKNSLKV